jgi:hypothetical protein
LLDGLIITLRKVNDWTRIPFNLSFKIGDELKREEAISIEGSVLKNAATYL